MIYQNSTISKCDVKRMHNGVINSMIVKKLLGNFLLEKLSIRSTLTDKCSLEQLQPKCGKGIYKKVIF